MELTSPRIRLREFEPADASAVHAFASDPEVTRFTDWGPNTPKDTENFLAAARGHAAERPRRTYCLAVTLRSTSELVGSAELSWTGVEGRIGRFGYVLRRDQWGLGLATEAARLLVDFGFEMLHLRRVEATCQVDNAASARVLEKLGLVRERIIRRHVVVRGAWRDSALYATDLDGVGSVGRPHPLLSS